MKGGQPYGGMTTSDITDLIWQNINGERFQTFLQGYVSDQLAEVDLGAVWSKIDEVEGRIASAESTIRAVASQTESFITAQTSANTELQNALSILQTKVTNIDGQLVAISTLGTRLTDVEGWINSANFVSVSTFNEAMASMSAAIDNVAEPPARCSLAEWSDLPVATTDEYPYLWMRIQEKNENGEITSTSYFRITSDDHRYDSAGNCVDAQFSMTQTPSAANIHSPYQVGDIYMRYKLPTESFSGDVDEDHPWVAMAFEGERDVNYSFNTSKNPAIGMAQVIVDIQNNEGFLTEAKLLTMLGNRTGSVYTGIKGIADDVVAGILAEVTDDDGKVTASSIVEALANDTQASTQMQSYFTTTVDNSTIENIVETKLNASVTGATWSEFVSTTNSTNSSYAGLASSVGELSDDVAGLLTDVDGLGDHYDAVNALVTHVVASDGSIKSSEIVQAINDSGSNILLSADKIYLNGTTFLQRLISEFENKKLTIDDGCLGVESTNVMQARSRMPIGENMQQWQPALTMVGEKINIDGERIYNDPCVVTPDMLATPYENPSWNIGYDKRWIDSLGSVNNNRVITVSDEAIDNDGQIEVVTQSPSNQNHIYSIQDDDYYVISTKKGLDKNGDDIPASAYVDGNVKTTGNIEVDDNIYCYNNIECFGNISCLGNISVGNNTGVTQTINLPSATSGKHYEIVISGGIIVGCSEVND